MSQRVRLVEQKGVTSIYVDVEITPDGDLLVSGQDVGQAPGKAYGDYDVEYWLKISAGDKDQVLLALLEKLYSGNALVVTELQEYLKSKDIPCDFNMYS